MAQPDPLWKRVLSGTFGTGVLIGLLVYASKRGATAEDLALAQKLFVCAGAAAGLVYFLNKKRKR